MLLRANFIVYAAIALEGTAIHVETWACERYRSCPGSIPRLRAAS